MELKTFSTLFNVEPADGSDVKLQSNKKAQKLSRITLALVRVTFKRFLDKICFR